MTERCSLRAFAQMVSVDEKAIRKAVQRGRLRESVGRDDHGRPFIRDAALALREWEDNASQVSQRKSARRSAAAALLPAASEPALISASTLNEAQRLATLERARKLRLENDVKRGVLIDKAVAGKEAFEASRIVREGLLNIPARLAAELAVETDPGRLHLRLEAALREALSLTADALLANGHEK